MISEAQWADYARIQSAAQLTAAVAQSHDDDVRLDRILDGITYGLTEDAASIERAAQSHGRKERARRRTRRLTEHAFMPIGRACPEQALIWSQAWARFAQAFSASDLRLLALGEIAPTTAPMAGADRTRLSRIRSSSAYRAVRVSTFS